MNLFDDSLAPRTRFDLNFRIGDISVRVHPYFWLSALFLSQSFADRDNPLLYLLAWAAVLFVSVLVHELGHVLIGRVFGSRGHILLTGFCGLAIGSSNLRERWQRIAVYFAGPAAGFLLGGVVAGISELFYPGIARFMLGLLVGVLFPPGNLPPPLSFDIIYSLLWVNLYWGLINLLPIWPLDGGQVCREACESFRRRHGLYLSLQISLFTSLIFALLGLIELITKRSPVPFIHLGLFGVIFFGILAFNSWRLMQFVQQGGMYEEEQEPPAPWERDGDWWKR